MRGIRQPCREVLFYVGACLQAMGGLVEAESLAGKLPQWELVQGVWGREGEHWDASVEASAVFGEHLVAATHAADGGF